MLTRNTGHRRKNLKKHTGEKPSGSRKRDWAEATVWALTGYLDCTTLDYKIKHILLLFGSALRDIYVTAHTIPVARDGG